MRDSIRWRLPLSYAAIALLAALALGAVLLVTLRSYYLRVEWEYLQSNAQAIAFNLGQLLEGDQPAEVLSSRLDSFSFLSGTRVRLLDAGGQLVASSNPPGRYRVALVRTRGALPVPRDRMEVEPAARSVIVFRPDGPVSATVTTTQGVFLPLMPGREQRLPLAGKLPGALPFPGRMVSSGFNIEEEDAYSSQMVLMPIYGSAEQLLGFVELSQGPGYAREIVQDVAWGWTVASAVAVALAAVAGWFASRRISSPLLALTEVTASMTDGDLSARADVARRDELGTLARSFNHMADQVEEIIVTLRRFVSDAAHEIHTPLTALHTNLELATQDEYVKQAQTQVERLEALTAGLLDLSRIESVMDDEAFAEVSMAELLREVSEPYASRAEQAGLAFELSLPDSPVLCRGDGAQLRQALTNLLDNALKFTPEGGSVRVALRQTATLAELWVEDSGIGIPEQDRPHLFQRFHRGRNAAAYPGCGLGLAIVRAIAERHGGQVHAERTAHGTRFRLQIPLG
jgi:signal transduction histidine kinase